MLRDKQNKGQEVECFIINILNLAEDAFDYDHSQYTFFELDDEKMKEVQEKIAEIKLAAKEEDEALA